MRNKIDYDFTPEPTCLLRIPEYTRYFSGTGLGSMYRVLVANINRRGTADLKFRPKKPTTLSEAAKHYDKNELVAAFEDEVMLEMLGGINVRTLQMYRKKLADLGLIEVRKTGTYDKVVVYVLGEYNPVLGKETLYIDEWVRKVNPTGKGGNELTKHQIEFRIWLLQKLAPSASGSIFLDGLRKVLPNLPKDFSEVTAFSMHKKPAPRAKKTRPLNILRREIPEKNIIKDNLSVANSDFKGQKQVSQIAQEAPVALSIQTQGEGQGKVVETQEVVATPEPIYVAPEPVKAVPTPVEVTPVEEPQVEEPQVAAPASKKVVLEADDMLFSPEVNHDYDTRESYTQLKEAVADGKIIKILSMSFRAREKGVDEMTIRDMLSSAGELTYPAYPRLSLSLSLKAPENESEMDTVARIYNSFYFDVHGKHENLGKMRKFTKGTLLKDYTLKQIQWTISQVMMKASLKELGYMSTGIQTLPSILRSYTLPYKVYLRAELENEVRQEEASRIALLSKQEREEEERNELKKALSESAKAQGLDKLSSEEIDASKKAFLAKLAKRAIEESFGDEVAGL